MRHHLVLRIAVKFLIPMIMLFALYVQFHGDYGPGGGFQAGVIFAAALVLYGLVFGLTELSRVAPLNVVTTLMAIGWMIYIGTGYAGLFLDGMFLDYNPLAAEPSHGQHYGIMLVEFGVGITVASTMLVFFHCYAGRNANQPSDGEW